MSAAGDARPPAGPKRHRWRRRAKWIGATTALTIALLWVPEPEVEATPASGSPFGWNQDAAWTALEARSRRARAQGCDTLTATIEQHLDGLRARLDDVAAAPPPSPRAPALQELETRFFESAAELAACPGQAARLVELQGRLREVVKDASTRWDLRQEAARSRLYRLLYGSRMAIEEVLLQLDPAAAPTLVRGRAEPSASPSTEIHGVRVHSGDLLVSRGGAPTSALIARGNDYPGNFSHVALVHVDEHGTFRTIEAHIEVGVKVAGLERYERDRKLRVLLLRPRADLAAGDFAHRAATHALERARAGHIPYDFAMDADDPDALFCSEVASQAYRSQGIELWEGLTRMSSPATARWLAAFGVRHFVTHGPSDLEYDPKLVAVAEWRDPRTLYQDHLDAAVIDAMLEGAAAGDRVDYDARMLPVARLLKAFSWLKNRWGAVGPIPEGMSATVALRVEWLRRRHARLRRALEERAAAFERREGYRPPYWALSRMASEARAALADPARP